MFAVLSLACSASSGVPAGDAGALDDAGRTEGGNDVVPTYRDRAPGTRGPLTARCDDADPSRCLLPWPSNTFAETDSRSPTGLRIALAADALAGSGDSPATANLADGFSRLSPLMTAFDGELDEPASPSASDAAVRLVVAQSDHDAYGEIVPLRIRLVPANAETLVIAYPLRPLIANADHVVAVLDALRAKGGDELPVPRRALLALGRTEPRSADEARIVAYHAPTREALTRAGIDLGRVVRLWEFTTRSAGDPTRWLEKMREASRAAVETSAVAVAVDSVEIPAVGPVAAIVRGHVSGLPSFVNVDGLSLDADGQAAVTGTREAPFRIAAPAGTGDYRIAMYGHGTGGSVDDSSHDAIVAELGLAKVGIEFGGWTESDLMSTLIELVPLIKGSHRAAALLTQSLADGAAIQRALAGPLGDLLSAQLLQGQPNPLAGRRPDPTRAIWVGGSLAGTMGLVYASADPEIRHGVLNVPGAAWSHWMGDAELFTVLMPALLQNYGTTADVLHAVGIAQLSWDPVDGANWAARPSERDKVFLVQESIGDPILPNPGTEMLAVSVGAVHVGPMLEPIVGVEQVELAEGRSGITQYRVADTKSLAIHGFAGRNTPAGRAAREQIVAFLQSVAAGEPRITLPSGCGDVTADGNCDFR